jgi:hypothetical protein
MNWLIGGMAEMYVAYRENRQLGQISRNGWLVTALFAAILIALLVVTLQA